MLKHEMLTTGHTNRILSLDSPQSAGSQNAHECSLAGPRVEFTVKYEAVFVHE